MSEEKKTPRAQIFRYEKFSGAKWGNRLCQMLRRPTKQANPKKTLNNTMSHRPRLARAQMKRIKNYGEGKL